MQSVLPGEEPNVGDGQKVSQTHTAFETLQTIWPAMVSITFSHSPTQMYFTLVPFFNLSLLPDHQPTLSKCI